MGMGNWDAALVAGIAQFVIAVYVYGKLNQKVTDHDGWMKRIADRIDDVERDYVSRVECQAMHGNGRQEKAKRP